MTARSVFLTVACIIFVVLCVPSSALAGTFVIDVPHDSDVSLTVFYSDGSRHDFGVLGTRGIVIFEVPNQNNVNRWTLELMIAGGPQFNQQANLSVPESLPTIEPFSLPTFSAAGITLTSSIDVNAFLAAGNPFAQGQTFSVVNGTTALSSALIFTDQFGNLFNGPVTVEQFYQVQPVPEPATLLLLATGLAGTFKKLRNKRRGARQNKRRRH